MRKTLKIAKLELSILFYSPVAWLVLIIFFIQSGMRFLGLFGGYQEAMGMGNAVSNLTFSMFPGTGGLFEQTLQNIYLYIPLLTMGLMAREISSGSIKLLLSSPVKIRTIILGKYLAITGYGLMLMLALSAYSITGALIIKNADVGLILSGLLGLFLLICMYAAIGLFMSSLTGYQVVAAISTLAVLAALQYIGGIGQELNFVRDLAYFLSISGRTDDMLHGLINSRDVLYFLTIICLFLSLTILRLKAARSPKHWGFQLMKYALVICLALAIIYSTSRPQFMVYKDMTANQTQTLTPNSQAIAKQIDGTLNITTYVNLLDQNVYTGLPASRNLDLSRFDQYRRYIPKLNMKYVYYYDITDLNNNSNMIYQGNIKGLSVKQVAQKVADNMGLDIDDFIPPKEIRKIINLSDEDNNLTRVLEYKGRTSKLRLYNEIDAFPSEREITAAIKRLVVNPPKIAFVTGHNERSISKTGDRNYQMIANDKKGRKSIINQGFDVLGIDLASSPIPDSLTALVIADPTISLTGDELLKIKGYLDKGGNMMITTEPGQQKVINPLLGILGVHVAPGMLVMPTRDNVPNLIIARTFEGMPVGMPSVAALSYVKTGKFKIDTILTSPAKGWNKLSKIDLSSSEVSYNPGEGDLMKSWPTAIRLTRSLNGRAQKIFISGDADFMDNGELKQPKGFNRDFAINLFSWFSGGKFPIDTARPAPIDNDILLKKSQIANLKLLFIGLIPLLIAVLGAYTLISRKRK
jgi:ABC-2 type transport system permease protein